MSFWESLKKYSRERKEYKRKYYLTRHKSETINDNHSYVYYHETGFVTWLTLATIFLFITLWIIVIYQPHFISSYFHLVTGR
jgi:hypothetical protein